jgi:hypothetical protein
MGYLDVRRNTIPFVPAPFVYKVCNACRSCSSRPSGSGVLVCRCRLIVRRSLSVSVANSEMLTFFILDLSGGGLRASDLWQQLRRLRTRGAKPSREEP